MKLSAEYHWMKRSFDGIHVGSLVPIKKSCRRTTSGSSSGSHLLKLKFGDTKGQG
jgi:hypothetical protein